MHSFGAASKMGRNTQIHDLDCFSMKIMNFPWTAVCVKGADTVSHFKTERGTSLETL